jgi:excisionase family DNA binding protein
MGAATEKLMTVKDVLDRLNISRTTLWRLVKNREIDSIHVGKKKVLFERRDIEKYIRKRTVPAKE